MTDKAPEYAYHLLRSALEKFGRTPAELTADQTTAARTQADATFELESRALSSSETEGIVISEHVDEALQGIVSRYASQEVSELDILLFYEAHWEQQFARPQIRVARHILVTVNPEFPDNTRKKAKQRMGQIQKRLAANPEQFAELARRYSECPSALEGGRLGRLPQGKLYPELDEALFELPEGGVSDIVETELGLHLVYCEKIYLPRTAPLSEARPQIRKIMEQRQRRRNQKIWLDALKS